METMETRNQIQTSDIADHLLIEAARQNLNDFEPLYHKYYIPVFRFIYQRMDSAETAHDLASDVFLKAMEKLSVYHDRGLPFLSWLYVIARNEVNQYYRKQKSFRKYYVEQSALKEAFEELNEDSHHEESVKLYQRFLAVLETLPENEYELFQLKHIEGRSFAEIALITGVNENNLRVKLHRIRLDIRKLLLNGKVKVAVVLLLMLALLLCAPALFSQTHHLVIANEKGDTLQTEFAKSAGYDAIGCFHDGRAKVYRDGMEGMIDLDGNIIVEVKYDRIFRFHNGRARVQINGVYGIIDLDGNEIVPAKYDSIGRFRKGRARVTLNGYTGLIDYDGNEIIAVSE